MSNDVKQMTLNREEILCLYALMSTREQGLIEDTYHFGDYREQRVCINKDNDLWKVYCCERGQKFDIETFDDCKKACIRVIWYCSYNKEEVENAIQYFLVTIQNSNTLSDEDIDNFITKYEFNIDTKGYNKKLVKELN